MTVTNHTYSDIANQVDENDRKALRGSVFGAATSADAITALTVDGEVSGTPTLQLLPSGWTDFGRISDAGAVLGSAVTQTDVMGWGSVVPVRSDITANSRTIQMVGLETNLMTMAAYFQTDPSTITLAETTDELIITEPDTPTVYYWRILALAVDQVDAGEIYLARFFPRASVTKLGNITFNSAKDSVTFDCTFTAYPDSALGFSSKFFGAGPGWKSLATGMGWGS